MRKLFTGMRSLREIEQEAVVRKLARHYTLDEENKTVEIALHYEKASDLFDKIDDNAMKEPRISEKTTNRMAQRLDDIPDGYRAKFSFMIDDYEGYTSSQLLEAVNDALSFRHLRFVRENERNDFRISLLSLAGILMAVIKIFGKLFGWWVEESMTGGTLVFLFDCLSCVLIWEAIGYVFMNHSDVAVFEQKVSRKVHSIGFYGSECDNALASESRKDIAAMMTRSKRILLAKRLLLVSSFSLIALAVIEPFTSILARLYVSGDFSTVAQELLYVALLGSVSVIGLRAYKGKLRCHLLGMVLTVLMLVFLVINLSAMNFSVGISVENWIMLFFEVASQIAFAVGFILYCLQYRQALISENR